MSDVNLALLLRLERPLAVLDLETTGFSPDADRVVQIALTIHYPHREPIAWSSLIHPGMPIAPASIETHHITDDMVVNAPRFQQVAPALAPKITDVDFCGYNVNFDLRFMRAEFKRANVEWKWNGHVVDSFEIYRKRKPHKLESAFLEYGGEGGEPLPADTKLDGAHDAGVDVRATERVLRGQLLRYQDLPRTVKELSEFCFPKKKDAVDSEGKFIWVNGVCCITFGKFVKAAGKPVPLHQVDKSYMKFLVDKDFSEEVKTIFKNAIQGVYPKQDMLEPGQDDAAF